MPMSKEKKREWEREHRQGGKSRKIWWGYLYLDSAPDDWETRIRESGIEAVWILHDRDVTAAGEVKKTHAHVALRFSHAVRREQAAEILTGFGVLEKSIQFRDSWRAVCRYMIHMDDPDKYQYPAEAVHESGGADWAASCSRTSDKYRTTKEMMAWVRETDCHDFSALLDYAAAEEETWFMALCDSSALIMREYIKSRRGKAKQDEKLEQMANAIARGIIKNERVRKSWEDKISADEASQV